ncbi:MAG: LemA family protein [Propionibacteriaceae bacterium]|jgi:hypothetical protein|nr:LemA family protein [Propionibacteriaceae bacterium]
MGWTLMGLGLLFALAGIIGLIVLIRYYSLQQSHTAIVQRWSDLMTELNQRQALLAPLAQATAIYAPQERAAVEELAALRNQALRLPSLTSVSWRAQCEARLEVGLNLLRRKLARLAPVQADPRFQVLERQIDTLNQRLRQAAEAYNSAVDSYLDQAESLIGRRLESFLPWEPPVHYALPPHRQSADQPAGPTTTTPATARPL